MLFRLLFVVGVFLLGANAQTCPTKCRYRMSKLSKRIKSLESQIVALETSSGGGSGGSTGPGAVFTRWGRTTCPENNSKLYTGVAAGSHYTHIGGGANYLCLPEEPQFANVAAGPQHCGGLIYGAEYEVCTNVRNIFLSDNADGSTVHNHDVPCAVCQATNRQSHVFIPARTECPAGWVMEYQGYVMSDHHAHKRSEFVCMDKAPETMSGGEADKNGALFYFAEAKCGSLPCPPYVDGNELPCVVCTR